MKVLFVALTLLSVHLSFAQDSEIQQPQKKMHGTFYVTWGYHKDYYTNSTIHFNANGGDHYDFKVHNATAHDQPDVHNLLTKPLTVPQYVFYGGYFFNNKGDWGIEGGWDHLKYVMTDNQVAHVEGTIRGNPINQDTLITPDFIHYEHTNGNNYLTLSLMKRFTFYKSVNTHHKVSFIAKAGGGILIPKTESVMLGNWNDGPFRFAGYVITTGGALRYDIYRYFFLEAAVKGAFAHYTDDKLYKEARAQQTFFSMQLIIAAGINIPLSKQ